MISMNANNEDTICEGCDTKGTGKCEFVWGRRDRRTDMHRCNDVSAKDGVKVLDLAKKEKEVSHPVELKKSTKKAKTAPHKFGKKTTGDPVKHFKELPVPVLVTCPHCQKKFSVIVD